MIETTVIRLHILHKRNSPLFKLLVELWQNNGKPTKSFNSYKFENYPIYPPFINLLFV